MVHWCCVKVKEKKTLLFFLCCSFPRRPPAPPPSFRRLRMSIAPVSHPTLFTWSPAVAGSRSKQLDALDQSSSSHDTRKLSTYFTPSRHQVAKFFCGSTTKKQEDLFYRLGLSQKKGKKTNFVERERARQVDRPSRWMAQRAENYRTTSTVSSWIRWVVQLTSSSSPSAWWTVPVFFSFDPSVQLSEKTEGNRKLHRRNNTRRSWKKIKEEKDKRTMAMASVASSSSSIQQLLFVVLSLQTIICHGKSSAPTL